MAAAKTVLIVDDDATVRSGLGALVGEPGRIVLVCEDPDAALEVVREQRPDCAFIDIKYSGPFGFEGLQLIEQIRALSPEATIVAMSGDDSSALNQEAFRRGASGFVVKPFGGSEIAPWLPEPGPGDVEAGLIVLPTIDEIIDRRLIEMVFQPIVTIDDGRPLGWEALARVKTETPFRMPAALFRYGRRRGRSFDLNKACAVAAIEAGAAVARDSLLFINVDPDILPRGEEFVAAVSAAASQNGVDMTSVVFEVTERHEIDAHAGLDALRALRATGASIAFDDLGIGYAHFPQLGQIRPSFMKVAQEFGFALSEDTAARAIVSHFRDLARAFECKLILEGIETHIDAATARELGVELAQGYHFGRPGPFDGRASVSARSA